MPIPKLTDAERATLATRLPEWTRDPERDAIRRTFRFPDFVAALGDERDHHPEWSNVYNRVDILLTTHDADGLSTRDIALAEAIDRL